MNLELKPKLFDKSTPVQDRVGAVHVKNKIKAERGDSCGPPSLAVAANLFITDRKIGFSTQDSA